ncbi:alpha/beta hydrolase [Lignipirellula cremea]|uniref:Acetyl esterase Axe7A n=1 Tax=Lignipirellula cremea TaxID=2528010 RepID=A0A518E0Q6_9BACT|nr:alpha/beta hydrolase [Lignipirellula cremea]QDU97675.1 Acetyl esterase Axe7A precursor [Lignipirellula cremea]
MTKRFPSALRRILLAGGLALLPSLAAAQTGPFDVLPETLDGGPKQQMVRRYLKTQTDAAFAKRKAEYEAVKTPEQALLRQQRLRALMIEHLGGFPERTPLNAFALGKLEGDGYRVEKLIYESQPRHYVTAVLFLPRGEGPFPAVVIPSGHSATAKAAEYNQRAAILLARNGIAALNYDPIGQGERSQLLDENGKPRFSSVGEHTTVGAGSIPLGRNTATFRIWDGMRSIDYLQSRPDIDGKRIGVTGCSGGGTLSSYLMALDERVVCAAPSCYLTSLERLLATIGPQDAEQNIHGQIGFGLDHADYVMLHAPQPTLMMVSTHDFFDIHGAWDNFRESKRFYTRLGYPERVSLLETDAKHGLPLLQREGMLRWMQRWLLDIDKPTIETEFDVFTTADLQCTPTGQTLLLDGARSVVDLNVEYNEQLARKRAERWKKEPADVLLAEVRTRASVAKLDAIGKEAKVLDTQQRTGATLEKIQLQPEPGILLPGLLWTPEKPTGPPVLYVHGDGKAAAAGPDQAIARLVAAGHPVLAIDLRGLGETGGSPDERWGDDWKDIFTSYLLGPSLVGMRATDVLCAARFLAERNADSPAPVRLIAVGRACVPALHAAALEPQLFTAAEFQQTLPNWSAFVANPAAPGQLVNVVHGALHLYDLPDLVSFLQEQKKMKVVWDPIELKD